MGNATLGRKREALPEGDYTAQIVDVELGEQTDFKDKSKMKPAFIWKLNLWVDEKWEDRKLYTPTYFTDMNQTPKPKAQFVSGLNKLVRACGQKVPQTDAECEAWDESELCGLQFIWRMEADPETGELQRKFVQKKAEPAAAPARATAKTEPAKPPKVDPFVDPPVDDDDDE